MNVDSQTDSVRHDLNHAIDEECTDEECGNCGEVHQPVNLEKALKRQTRWYRATVAAYFGSLIATAYCAYELLGVWGAAGFVSSFGAYFFHLNMNAMIRIMMSLEQVSFGAVKEEKGDAGHHGNYA